MSGVEHYVDRVDTEKARLQEEVLSYEAVLDHVPEAIAVCVDSRIAYVNSAAITLLQAQSASHLSGREFVDFIHQDFRPLIARRQVETQGADSQPHFKFIRLQLQSSSIVEAQWAGIPIHYHGRGAVLNIFRDISEERKQAEALRAIVNATAGSGVDFFEGLVSQLATVLGMSYALVAKLLPGNSPRARTLALWARGKLLQNVEYDLASSPCEQLIGKDLCHFPSGVQAHFPKDDLLARMGAESYYGVPLLGSNHKPLGVLCVLNEQPMPDTELAGSLMRVFASRAVSEMEHLETIEALKASEATYRRLHESMIDAFVAADLDGRITDHNESFRRMLGYDPSEILRLTLCDIIAGTWKDYQDGVIQQQVLKRGYSDIIEEDFRRKDGNVLPVELRIVLLRDAAGVPSGSWAIVRDIAKRKATQEALRRQLAFTELVTGVLAQFATCTEAEIDDHIQVSLRDIAQFFGVDYAFIALAAEDFSHWSATHGWASSELPDRLALYQNVPMGSFAWIEKTLLAGQIVQVRSLDDLPPEAAPIRKRYEAEGFRSTLQVPLLGRGGQVRGCLGLFGASREPGWNEADIPRLKLVSDAVANALERQQALESLKQSEAKGRALLDAVSESLFLLGRNGEILATNSTAVARHGLEGAFGILEEGGPWKQGFKEVIQTGNFKRFDAAEHGRTYDFCLCPVLDASGNVTSVAVFATDITERKKAEALEKREKQVLEMIAKRQRLPDVLDTICRFVDELVPGVMSSILLLDPDGQRLWPTAGPHLPEEFTRAISPWMIGPVSGACGTAAWRKEQVVIEDIATDPLCAICPELLGITLNCGLRACWSTPITSATGQMLGTFAMYYSHPIHLRQGPEGSCPERIEAEKREISEIMGRTLINHVTHLAQVAIEQERASEALRRAHEELEQRVRERTSELVTANQRLKEVDRVKSQFLATMSHELRTPLNTILGFSGILRQGLAGPVNDEQAKQLGLVYGSAKHLLSLINDLLDLSRIEAGRVELENEPLDFVGVIAEVVDNLKPLADQKRLRILVETPGNLIIKSDRKRAFQVLLNVVNNAIKFTERGEVRVSASLEGDFLEVRVSDTGIGIKPEQMGLLFEAFRQLDGSAKRAYEGTGLGLHLCRRLLRLMGGEISARSVHGQGSCFTFTLPVNP